MPLRGAVLSLGLGFVFWSDGFVFNDILGSFHHFLFHLHGGFTAPVAPLLRSSRLAACGRSCFLTVQSRFRNSLMLLNRARQQAVGLYFCHQAARPDLSGHESNSPITSDLSFWGPRQKAVPRPAQPERNSPEIGRHNSA
jgi:hypothetical protein